MIEDLPYRRSAGVALINRQGDVFIGQRLKERELEVFAGREWQMPQGGIDSGETPLAAAKRELYEETNVRSTSLIAEAPEWWSYDLPIQVGGRWRGRYRGQTQRWFLFWFEGDDSEVDIHNPAGGHHSAEFRDWRWERWEALPDLVVPFKREVYQKVVAFFAPIARALKGQASR
jgi:putative (di)nucleoside polyphosphate hydrolase